MRVMRLQLAYAFHLIGYERRHTATTWAKSLGKWAATVTLWGITTGLTFFALLWAYVFVAWVAS